jgi:RHS repeat-associated protein
VVLVLGFAQGSTPQPGDEPTGTGGGRGGLSGLRDSLRSMFGVPDAQPKREPTARLTLPVRQPAPTGPKRAPAKRVRELTAKRTESAAFYQLSDGSVQAEVASAPVRYRDTQGRLQPIDTTVVARGGVLQNTTNSFASRFGQASGRLVDFELQGHAVEVGLDGPLRTIVPQAKGNTVTYTGAFGSGVDLRYRVTGGALKDEIVLAGPASAGSYTFRLKLHGLSARQLQDGSIGLFSPDAGDEPLLVLPQPYMFDSRRDASSPYGVAWSPKVKQTLAQDGEDVTVTVTPDAAWLADKARAYPVVIDPTIKIQPTPSQSQDAMIVSDSPGTNFDGNWRLSVGTTPAAKARSLVKFDLSGVPAGTRVDTAALQLYFDQDHTSSSFAVPLEARRVTSSWTETGVTWNSINAAVGEAGANIETVDDSDTAKVAINGEWPASTNTALTQYAVNSTYLFNKNAISGDTFTWVPRITESGNYLVEAHYVAASDRTTAAPYTVRYNGGQATQNVNQTLGTNGVWTSLGTYNFAAGTAGSVVLGDTGATSAQAVIADAVRLTKAGGVTKAVNESGVWHSYGVRNIVQGWLDGANPNYGFMVKAVDEATLGRGGPRYEAAEYAYNGENENTPKLILTYGQPGVTLDAPTKIYSTGAELHWSAYAGSDLLEYQVHRSVFQTFTPSAATLISPIKAGTTTFTDTTATPTPVDSTDPFGQVYYYMIVVKTTSGALIPAPTEIVRLPRAGRIVQILQGGALDTTLSSTEATTGHDVLTGKPWLSVGNNSGTFGKTRAVVKFPDVSAIPAGARVLDAEFDLWSITTQPAAGATYEVHALNRTFDEATATWNKANATTSWMTAGGDYNSTVNDIVVGNTDDPAWRLWWVDSVVQGWIDTPASNNGLLVKLANETTPAERTLFLSSEAAEPQLRPKLVVTYTQPVPAQTYYVPDTPLTRTGPGDTETVPVTVSNPTAATWSAANWELSYHWALPDGTDVTNAANQVATPLPADVTSGQAVTVNAQLKTPTQTEIVNSRNQYTIKWELHNKTTNQWLSTTDGIAALDQNVVVEEPTSDQLGLEKFYQYTGMNTGAGSSAAVNLASGNMAWSYDAFNNPTRGLPSFARMTYNSLDTDASAMGFGWSLSTSTLHRLGSPIELHPKGQSWPTRVTLIDGDGTSHFFTLNKHGSTDEAQWDYDQPHGVHLYLQKNVSADPSRTWVMTKPDRTRFFFDDEGYQTAAVDNNGNELTFAYTERKSNNKPTKFLQYITDAAGRRTLELTYFAKGDSYTYIDDITGAEINDTNLTNPKIIDQVRSLTDVAGRRVEFTYTVKGLMAKLADGVGSSQPKVFRFTYDMTQGNKNVKLVGMKDPRGSSASFAYYDPPGDNPKFHWWAKTMINRLGNATSIAYVDPDGPPAGPILNTTVTDPELHNTVYVTDAIGRPTQVTNAKNEVTKLAWDAENNLIRLEEPNTAVTTWTYDAKTGRPLTNRDPEANKNGTAATTMTYNTGLNGYIADLATTTSPEGRVWTYTYDSVGNPTGITDPAGSATPAAGDFTTSYSYDSVGQVLTKTDANGHTKRYADYTATSSPQTITDALNHITRLTYDARGNVLTSTNALNKTSTYGVDLYSRVLDVTVPVNAEANSFSVLPAPVYDANDNVLSQTDAVGAVTTSTYDAADQLLTSAAPKDTPTGPARVTAYTYDKVGNVLTATEPRGTATTGNPDDFVTRYAYDAVYQLSTITDPAGGVVTTTYDNVGNVIQGVDARKNATTDPSDYSVKYAYNLNHAQTTITDAAGNVSRTGYDRDGNVISQTDQNGNTTVITLDPRALPTTIKVPHAAGGPTVDRTTTFEYDAVGNQTKTTTPRGVATTNDPDDFAQVTIYDELDRVKEQIFPYDRDDPRYNTPADKVINTYDEVGNLTKVSAPPSAGQTVRNDTVYAYFDNGWIKSSTDPWDIGTTYDYDKMGRQTHRVITAAGGDSSRSMTWTYYPDGKLKSKADDGAPVGRHVGLVDNSDNGVLIDGTWTAQTTGSGYTGYNYLTHPTGTGVNDFVEWKSDIPVAGDYELWVKYPQVSGAATNATYLIGDEFQSTQTNIREVTVDLTQHVGEWVSLGKFPFQEGHTASIMLLMNRGPNGTLVADAAKVVRDNTADADPEAKNLQYAYDVNGNLTSITDASSDAVVDTYTVGYSPLNKVQSVAEIAAGVTKHTTAYDYDPNGNPMSMTHDGAVTGYEYDNRDLISKVTNPPTGSGPSKVTTYQYTPRGQLSHSTIGNGNVIDYTYFLDGMLSRQTEKQAGGAIVADHTLDYDLNGNRSSDAVSVMNADNHGAQLAYTATYTYDPRDRIATVRRTGATTLSEDYVHDANNNIISETLNGAAVTHTYDRNRLVKTDGANQAYTTYDYDPFGRLETVRGLFVTERYVYDGFDRVFQKTRTVHPPNPSETTTRYAYDPLDRTLRKTENVGAAAEMVTSYDYLGLSDLVSKEQNSTGSTTYEYGRGGDRLDQVKQAAGGSALTSYYAYNAHTDVEALTDEGGATRATYGYTVYGKDDTALFTGVDKPDQANPDKPPFNVYRFNAKPVDVASGNYDMGARDYSPIHGRFLTRDSYGGADADMGLGTNPATMNRYAFAGGNPVNTVEVDGHYGCGLFSISITCPKTSSPFTDANGDGYVTPGDIAQNVWTSKCAGMSTWQGQAICGGMAPGVNAIVDLYADLSPVPFAQAMKCQQGSWSGCGWTGLAIFGAAFDAPAAANSAAKAGKVALALEEGGNISRMVSGAAKASGSPAQLVRGRAWEAAELAKAGLAGNDEVWRPTAEQIASAAFKVIVGPAKYTAKTGLAVGVKVDSIGLELKGGVKVLESSYQLRLMTYRALVVGEPLTLRTARPINPTFEAWLIRWGVTIEKVP